MSAIRLDRVDWTAPPEAVIPTQVARNRNQHRHHFFLSDTARRESRRKQIYAAVKKHSLTHLVWVHPSFRQKSSRTDDETSYGVAFGSDVDRNSSAQMLASRYYSSAPT